MADSRVYPVDKIPARVINLPPPDVFVPKIWASRMLFWPISNPADYDQCYQNLKEGLSRLLSDIPTLVGNIHQGATDDYRDLTITIRDGASVEFTFEDVTSGKTIPSFYQLKRTGFPTTGLVDSIFPKILLGPITDGSPMFAAKLNRLDGGVILAYASNHAATDGWAVSEMEKIWAKHTVDVSEGTAFRSHKIPTADDEIRQWFREPVADPGIPLNPALEIVPSREAFMRLHKNPAEASAAGRKAIWKIMGLMSDTGERPEPRASTIFKFTPNKLAELKKAASSSNPEEWISTMDALVALFWSRIAHIQGQSRKGHQRSLCFFYVNARSRVQPPIPMPYIGNVVIPTSTECSLLELESDSAGLKAAAQSLRKANSGWNQDQFNSLLHTVTNLPVEKAIDVNRGLILGKHNLSYNDLSKFSSNVTDWGAPLGQVARTRLPRGALPGGAHGVVVYPKLPDGSLEVMVGINEGLRKALMNDPVFKQFAELVCVSIPPGTSRMTSIITQSVFTLHSTTRKIWRLVTGHRTALAGILLAFALYTGLTRKGGRSAALN